MAVTQGLLSQQSALFTNSCFSLAAKKKKKKKVSVCHAESFHTETVSTCLCMRLMEAVGAEAVVCGVIAAVPLKSRSHWMIKRNRCGDGQKQDKNLVTRTIKANI